MKRMFLMGVARSGTTLLQSILGSNEEVLTFPETHFFSKTIPKQKILRYLTKVNFSKKSIIKNFFDNNYDSVKYIEFADNNLNYNKWAKYLIMMLDEIAKSKNKNIWLEKTPLHLYYTDLISKLFKDTVFIYIIRNPIDNISSLYDVSKKYPDSFAQPDLEKAFNRYHKEIKIINKNVKIDNHYFVYYEDLVETPEKVIRGLCKNIGIDFKLEMLNYTKNVNRIALKNEKWKLNNYNRIKASDLVKERLTNEEFKWLEKKVKEINAEIIINKYE